MHEVEALRRNSKKLRAAMFGGVLLHKLQVMQSDYLILEATRLMIPLPDQKDERMWIKVEEQYVLTPKAINDLRAAICAEKTARVQLFMIWVPGVTGLIGALIGLASVFQGTGK